MFFFNFLNHLFSHKYILPISLFVVSHKHDTAGRGCVLFFIHSIIPSHELIEHLTLITWGLLDILINLKRFMVSIGLSLPVYSLVYYYGVTFLNFKACLLELANLYQARNTITLSDPSFNAPFLFLMMVHPFLSLYVANAAVIVNEKPPVGRVADETTQPWSLITRNKKTE